MRILLIDDNIDCLTDLYANLVFYHQCEMFTVPEEAIAAYRKTQYDVVITDMMMPGMDGLEVLKRVRQLNPQARVIITAGYPDADTVIAAINQHAYAFCDKPVDFRGLMKTLWRIDRENQETAHAG